MLRYDAVADTLETWAEPPGKVEVPAVHSQVVTYPSKDGTLVRMFVVSPAGAPDQPRPTTLYGYGGFNIPMTPGFSAGILAWVEAGGVYAIACLRGGSEEGEDWHRAGRRDRKQNVFDDFAAAAEWLVAEGWTTSEQLGHLRRQQRRPARRRRPHPAARALRRRRLLGAAARHGPVRGLGARPAVVRRVRHRVRPDRARRGCWATRPTTGWSRAPPTRRCCSPIFDSDSRVDPMHARKLCAALQWATSSDRPVLLRREADVGHAGRSVSRSVELSVDSLSFAAARTGLVLGT